MPGHISPPKTMFGADSYIEAFWSLSTDRPNFFSVGMIPFSSIDRYAKRFGYDGVDEFTILERMIRLMDQVYLDKKRSKTDG